MNKVVLKDFPLSGSHLIEASAGTGKTYTIAALYLRLVAQGISTGGREEPVGVPQILVVTFTKAAVSELKERLRKILTDVRRHFAEDPDFKDPEIVDPGLRPIVDGLDAEKAVPLLEKAITEFDGASIFTIHGFCQKVLSEGAFTLSKQVPRSVDDGTEVYEEALRLFFEREVLPNQEDFGALVSCDLGIGAQAWRVAARMGLGEPNAVFKGIPVFKEFDTALYERGLAIVKSPGFREDLESFFARPKTDILQTLRSVEHEMASKAVFDELQKPLRYADIVKCWEDFGKSHVLGPLLWCSDPTVLSAFTKKAKRKQLSFGPKAWELSDILGTLASSAGQARAWHVVEKFRDQAPALFAEAGARLRTLTFDAMITDLMRAVSPSGQGCAASRLANIASLRAKYRAVMVDEFQDTDFSQYEIFKNAFLEGDNRGRFFCAVGDPKQSIYRFRSADIEVYLEARRAIGAANTHTLSDNYRSCPEILGAVNRIFCIPGIFRNQSITYDPVACGSPSREKLYVRGEPVRACVVFTSGEQTVPAYMKDMTRTAARRIAEMISPGSGYVLARPGRPARPLLPGDIAVLVRRNSEVQMIAKELRNYGIAVKAPSRVSIYDSAEFAELVSILEGVLYASSAVQVKTALATTFFDSREVMTGTADGAFIEKKMQEFSAYRDDWKARGAGYLLKKLMGEARLAGRFAGTIEGEALLTNWEHLLEILYRLDEDWVFPEALLTHLKSLKAEESTDEETDSPETLRLPSDEKIVTVMTYHKCKGLEFPVVFLPYIQKVSSSKSTGTGALDYFYEGQVKAYVPNIASGKPYQELIKEEREAEAVRLFYVAATRACAHVELGLPGDENLKIRGLTDWLSCCLGGLPPVRFLGGDSNVGVIGAVCGGRPTPERVSGGNAVITALPGASRKNAWVQTSYSGLMRGAQAMDAIMSEGHADDAARDAVLDASGALAVLTSFGLPKADILCFPRGAQAGETLHEYLEKIDFTDDALWERTARECAARFFPENELGALVPMMLSMSGDIVRASLGGGIKLSQVALSDRKSEMPFYLSMRKGFSGADLMGALARHPKPGYDFVCPNAAPFDRGYLKGFIDLVFLCGGKYYIVDWKSNFLSDSVTGGSVEAFLQRAYSREGMLSAMRGHGYCLQYLLYTVALVRFLRKRLPGFSYEKHIGGVRYVFLRGTRPGLSGAGVWEDLPDKELIDELDRILG